MTTNSPLLYIVFALIAVAAVAAVAMIIAGRRQKQTRLAAEAEVEKHREMIGEQAESTSAPAPDETKPAALGSGGVPAVQQVV
ncbi:MAG: hypothetical protein M3R41_11430, partial [Pseudomonadota bacterium]|nr:hypothetical protein [Pseudomonadota bacterium]